MKNYRETILRLLVIYDHFANGELYQDYSWYPELLVKSDMPVTVFSEKRVYYDAFPFVFGELPYLFCEWEH